MYEWSEHTAELELRVSAPDEAAVFAEALAALAALLGERSDVRGAEPARHEIAASAPDRATLLAEWLNELLFLVETEEFLPTRVSALRVGSDDLEATVDGRRAAPPHLVKAVTYHRLDMHSQGGQWHATVVFDV